MNCQNCSKGFNQPLAHETICMCRQNKKCFLQVVTKPCRKFRERKIKNNA